MTIGDELGPVTGPQGPGGPTETGEGVEEQYFNWDESTLTRSEQEQLMLLYLASMPQLPIPLIAGMSVEDIALMVEEKMQTVGREVLEAWSEQVKEQAEKFRARLLDPDLLNQLHWIRTQQQLGTETYHNRKDENMVDAVKGVGSYSEVSKDDAMAVSFMTASFVIAAGFIGDYMGVVDTVSTEMVEVNPIQNAVPNFNEVIPPHFLDSTVLAINLFASGLIYQATAATLGGVKPNGEQPKDIEFARNYIKEVMKKVNSNEINQFLNALLIHKTEAGKPVSPQRINQLARIAKLAMLSMALALFMKVEEKWVSGLEFGGMLKKNPYDEGTPEHALVNEINTVLKQLNPEESAQMLETLMAYFDSNPSIEALLDPKKALEAALQEAPDQQLQA